jgi:hypothetical protein
LGRVPADSPLKYVDHIEGFGLALFQKVCELDLEGVVAKHKFGPYVTVREKKHMVEIRNRGYSQIAGREQLFERERHQEPCGGVACLRVGMPRI